VSEQRSHVPERNTPEDVLERRTKVARLMVAMERPTVRRIAKQLNVSHTTIGKDVKAIRGEWKEQRLRDWEERLAEELAKLDQQEQELWTAWERSKRDATEEREQTKRVELDLPDGDVRVPGTEITHTHIERGRLPDPRYMEAILRCQDRRARLLGLDAPDRLDITGGGDRVFAFTLKIGDTLIASQSNEPEALDELKRTPLPEGAAIIRVGPNGKHHPEKDEEEEAPVLEPGDEEDGNPSGNG
jgi:hypothetical protein